MNNDEKQLFNYIHKTFKNILIGVGCILFGIAGICIFFVFISSDNVIIIKYGRLIFSLIFIFAGVSFIKGEPEKRKKIKDFLITETGREMISDFQNTKEYFDDSFRLGRKFLFIKGSDVPILISKIKIVAIQKNQDSCYLLCVLMENKPLTELRYFNKSEFNENKEEIHAFLKEITSLNSRILIKA